LCVAWGKTDVATFLRVNQDTTALFYVRAHGDSQHRLNLT